MLAVSIMLAQTRQIQKCFKVIRTSETLDSSVARGLDWLYEDARFDPRGDKKLLQDLDGKSAPCKPRCGNRRAAGRGPDHAVSTPPGDVQSQAKQVTPRLSSVCAGLEKKIELVPGPDLGENIWLCLSSMPRRPKEKASSENAVRAPSSTERVRQSVPVQMVLVCTQLMTNISERSAGDQKEPSPRRVLITLDQA
ncbi:hypothetical protein RRG08_058241 [Elysia crispata]|uniref:Uncharacterized protein n=1 Tax=Elysia crispata TaxID=231223 RepID=A0AAE1AKT5_9GAST|nr:hypothetical protein RRG08_058241 [Elysia crispata]